MCSEALETFNKVTKVHMRKSEDSPLQDDVSLDNHLQLIGHDLAVGVVLIFTVDKETGREKH